MLSYRERVLLAVILALLSTAVVRGAPVGPSQPVIDDLGFWAASYSRGGAEQKPPTALLRSIEMQPLRPRAQPALSREELFEKQYREKRDRWMRSYEERITSKGGHLLGPGKGLTADGRLVHWTTDYNRPWSDGSITLTPEELEHYRKLIPKGP